MKSIKTNFNRIALAVILLLTMMLSGCAGEQTAAEQEDKHQTQVFAMDTVMLLTAYGENGETALTDAEEIINSLADDLDPENPNSSVYAINAGAGTAVSVSRDCYDLVSTSLRYYFATDGALDPGLYPIINAWGFISGEYQIPDTQTLNTLLSAKNTGMIQLDQTDNTVCIPAGMEVSFGAVGKGFTAQKVIDSMAADGVESAILSLGGNVQTLGDTKPDGSSWVVAVTDPNDTGSYVGMLTLGQAAVVTSGGYQRFFVKDGVTYIHIIDPSTGYPVDNDLLSVTVVTDDGGTADALSTALFVMGKDDALAYYEENGGFELVLITKENHVIITPGLTDCFTEQGSGYTYEYLK